MTTNTNRPESEQPGPAERASANWTDWHALAAEAWSRPAAGIATVTGNRGSEGQTGSGLPGLEIRFSTPDRADAATQATIREHLGPAAAGNREQFLASVSGTIRDLHGDDLNKRTAAQLALMGLATMPPGERRTELLGRIVNEGLGGPSFSGREAAGQIIGNLCSIRDTELRRDTLAAVMQGRLNRGNAEVSRSCANILNGIIPGSAQNCQELNESIRQLDTAWSNGDKNIFAQFNQRLPLNTRTDVSASDRERLNDLLAASQRLPAEARNRPLDLGPSTRNKPSQQAFRDLIEATQSAPALLDGARLRHLSAATLSPAVYVGNQSAMDSCLVGIAQAALATIRPPQRPSDNTLRDIVTLDLQRSREVSNTLRTRFGIDSTKLQRAQMDRVK